MRSTLSALIALVGGATLACALAGCASEPDRYRSPYEGSMSVPEGKPFAETPEERAERRAKVRGESADK